MTNIQYNPLRKLPANTQGYDFVVSDLHGCYDDLQILMDYVKFDTSKDRLFSVGDLVDRGPKCLEVARLMYENYFYPVRGNHEQLCIDSVIHKNQQQLAIWMVNGGNWALLVDEMELHELAVKMTELPIVIAVGEGKDRFNIVHAELGKHAYEVRNNAHVTVRLPVSDSTIDNWEFDMHDEFGMLWGRNIVCDRHILAPIDEKSRFHSKDLSLTFSGHTVIENNVQIEQQFYLDLGGVFHYTPPTIGQSRLSLADVKNRQVHQLFTATKEVKTISFDDVLKFHQ